MIRSRAAASRAPAAPPCGRSAPPDPAARSQRPAAIRAREHSEARPKPQTGPRGTTCDHRGDAGKRTASGLKERSVEPLALPIRARFVPLRGQPDCSPDWCMPGIPGGGSPPFCSRWAAGSSCSYPRPGAGFRIGPRHPIEAATEAVTGCAPPAAGWKTGTTPGRATLPADLDAARAAASCRKGFPVSLRRDWIWLSRSCTCRGLVMYLSCTRPVAAPRETSRMNA